jgi:hypothetical protein
MVLTHGFSQRVFAYEEERKMRFISSIEELGMAKGMLANAREMVAEVIFTRICRFGLQSRTRGGVDRSGQPIRRQDQEAHPRRLPRKQGRRFCRACGGGNQAMPYTDSQR